jgi:diamine N-acetyltransferase
MSGLGSVRLEPVGGSNVRAVLDLKVAPEQERFVASTSQSLDEAREAGDGAWPRATIHDDEVVGFLMLELDPQHPEGRTFRLWRLMIAAGYQRQGLARAALDLVFEEVRSRGGSRIWTSWIPGDGGPGPFYLRLGFVPTGEVNRAGEVVGYRTV